MAPGTEGGFTRLQPENIPTTVFEASEIYREREVPLIVIAGKNYGCGSSRDWAAKGTRLLGIRATIAESYERIHRSNLIGMGVLPLQLPEGTSAETLNLDGTESFDFAGLSNGIKPGMTVYLTVRRQDGRQQAVNLLCRVDTGVEAAWLRAGGILPHALRSLETEAIGNA
jgi:aconitate hydratase